MKSYALKNAKIYTGSGIISDQVLLIAGDRIQGFLNNEAIPEGYEIIDLDGGILAPGLIDLQIYGGGGVLFAEKPTVSSMKHISDALVESGTTSFLMTLATNTETIFDQALEAAKEHLPTACLGLHFEGPYLQPSKRGAHPLNCLRKPDLETLDALLGRAQGMLKMMTVAPELFKAEELALLKKHGVLLSAGHSDADYATACQGFEDGIEAVTHLFNAMSSLHHRDPGLPGATFLSKNIKASIIVDGIHVAYETVAISKKIMGERLFLITDAIAPSSSGTYTHIFRGDRYVLEDGTLSGSALTMLQAVQNCVEKVGISLEEALRMATLYPAQLIGRDDLGMIKPGNQADLILFDESFQLKQVFLKGKLMMSVD